MTWTVYLSGEIHTDWREQIINGASNFDLPTTFTSATTDHEASIELALLLATSMQAADAESAKAHKLMLERLMRKHAQDSRRRVMLAAAVERLTRKERPGSVSVKASGSRGRRPL